MYDYADYNETLLHHQSTIVTREYDTCHYEADPDAYKKFAQRFPIVYYRHPHELNHLVTQYGFDVMYLQKAGSPRDGLCPTNCWTIVHAVFDSRVAHGDRFVPISDFVNRDSETNHMVLPYMVRIANTQADLRSELQLPKEALVFGTYSGKDVFDIPYVKHAVDMILQDEKNNEIYFVFMNIVPWITHSRVRFLAGTSDMVRKRQFINTCDAMLYGRDGGETFGLACAEFSLAGKPVICRAKERCDFHLTTLKDLKVTHNNILELLDILLHWKNKEAQKKRKENGYEYYTPERVMKIFEGLLPQS